jgi:hypothetical protein
VRHRPTGIDDRVGALIRGRRALRSGDPGAIRQDDRGANPRAAEIDCDDGPGGQGETSVSIVLERRNSSSRVIPGPLHRPGPGASRASHVPLRKAAI